MSVRDLIIQCIRRKILLPVEITEDTDLYRDAHLDSLAFVRLLLEIEEQLGILFELSEMEACLSVGYLIDLAEKKGGSENGTNRD